MFTIFGTAGQAFTNKVQGWKGARSGTEGSSWLSSKWSPLRKMSDEEYEGYMSERMLKVEAEIALIDDKIAELRAEERAKQGASDGPKAVPPTHDVQKEGSTKGTEKPQKSSWWRWR